MLVQWLALHSDYCAAWKFVNYNLATTFGQKYFSISWICQWRSWGWRIEANWINDKATKGSKAFWSLEKQRIFMWGETMHFNRKKCFIHNDYRLLLTRKLVWMLINGIIIHEIVIILGWQMIFSKGIILTL